jgi:hypothetical protein
MLETPMVNPQLKLNLANSADESTDADGAARAQVHLFRPKTSALHPAPDVNEDAEYAVLMEMLGTADRDFADGIFAQLVRASARGNGKWDSEELFFCLAVIKQKRPKDELAAMLLAQMSAVHAALMKAIGSLARAETLLEHEAAARTVNQLARTYSGQLDTYKRYRSGLAHAKSGAGAAADEPILAATAARQAATVAVGVSKRNRGDDVRTVSPNRSDVGATRGSGWPAMDTMENEP